MKNTRNTYLTKPNKQEQLELNVFL